MLTGQNLIPQYFSISHHRSSVNSEMARFVGTKIEFGADSDEFALTLTHVSCRLFTPILISMTFSLNIARRR
jgi:hypothetical protein